MAPIKRFALAFLTLALAAAIAVGAQAQTPPPPTYPANPTAYNAFNLVLAQPTSGPIMQMPVGATQCSIVLNAPSTNTGITPQGSDDFYTWHALPAVGGGSIRFPGLYVGPNPYKYFRPYFTNYASPGITGYEACGDNTTSLIAPMLNGIDGVLNTYQELIAIGHAGCASFDANGFLLPTGSACSGGGGSTCANPPSPAPSPSPLGCVVLQDQPSPVPQQYNDGQGSAAVAGILQGGSLWTHGGEIATQNRQFGFCADEPSGSCEGLGFFPLQFSDNAHGMDIFQIGNSTTFSEVGGGIFSASADSISLQASGANDYTRTTFVMNLESPTSDNQILERAPHIEISANNSTSNAGTFLGLGANDADIAIGCCQLSIDSTIHIGDEANVTSVEIPAKLDGATTGESTWSICTMSSATTCSVSNKYWTYASPICFVTAQGSSPLSAACSVTAGTATLTASSSNSLTWAILVVGNPN